MGQRSPQKSKDDNQVSEELYRALFEQAADGIFIANKEGRCIEVNERGCEMLGYMREEILGSSVEDLISAEDLAHNPLRLDELRTGSPVLQERRFRCKDGRLLPVEISAQMLADGRFLGIVRDISKHRQAEEQLRESNERFRLLAESSLTGIYLIQNNRFRYVNPAMAHIFGYEVEEIIDKLGPMDLVYSDDRPLVAENIRRRVEGEEEAIHYDFRGLRKDGLVIDIEVHGRRIEYSGKMGVIGTLLDITERKQAEEALRTSEEQLHFALDAAQMGLWNWNITTGEVVWSQKCLALYGLPPDTQMSYEQFLQALHPEDRERIDAALSRAVEEHTGYDEQKRAVWPDGSVHWTASRGQVYYDATGEPIRMIGVTFDISKWKEAEKEHERYLWFLESLDQVNRAMQGTNDLEQMMSHVLDMLLSIFECDRAWLVYPCDPEATSWQSMMEKARPEYPGVIPIGIKLPLEPVDAEVFRILRAAHSPVQFGPGSEHEVPVPMAQGFSVQSFIAMALYPKVGLPWSFGLHQCSYSRVWTPEEQRLFQEIGRRLTDSLTSLLSYRNLRASEEKYRSLIQKVQTAILLHDKHGRILASNPLAQQQLGFTEDQLLGKDLTDSDWHFLREDGSVMPVEEYPVSLVLATRQPLRDYKSGIRRPDQDHTTWVLANAEPEYDDQGEIAQIIVSFINITALWQAEDELRQNREVALRFSEQLTVLQEITNQLSQAESSDDLCQQAVQLGRSRLGFDRASIWFIEEQQGIMRGSFGTDERGELRDERNAQVEFKREGLAWHVFVHKESMALVERRSLQDHQSQKVGEGENAVAALWDGDEVIGIISIDNLFTRRPITERQLEVLKLYATTLGHLITRKRAEEALRASEARFRTLVDHAADAFYLHDNKGTILDVNQKACQSLGYSRDELIGKTPQEFDAGPNRPFLNQLETQLDAGEEIEFETRHRRKDGTEFPVEVRGRPFWQGEQRFSVSLARDVSERKRTQEALTLFRTLIDNTYDAIEVIDPETGRFLDANEQAYHALGYTREEFLNLSVPEINPVVSKRSWEETIGELRRSGSLVRESQHQRKDGSIFPIEINISYTRLDSDYVLAVVRDITERKQVEEALRESEERLRQIASSLREAVWLRDVQTRQVLYVNPAFQELTGRTCESFYEDRDIIMDAVHPDDKEWVSEALDQRFENIPFGKEHRIIHLDGSVRWVWSQIFPVRNEGGEVYRWASIMEDITDRKQAEIEQKRLLGQIQEQAQQVQNIIDTVPEGVILFSKDQSVTLTNPVARQYLALLAPGFQDGRLTHLGERLLEELLTSPPKGLWHEITSNNLIFEAITRPIENGPDNGGWVLVLRDITQERDIQQRVQQQERLAAVGQLAAGIAHDFNNILSVIILYAQLTLRTAELPVKSQERLHTIEEQTKRATDLIQQILDFSRLSVLERRPLDLRPFIEELVRLLNRTLPEHIRLELHHTDDSFVILADQSRIQQVMMNLAVNARDAMPEGGHLKIRLTRVSTGKPQPMPLNDLPPGEWIRVEVADSGEGIPPEILSHIFEPFFTTKQVGAGSGLGLAQVYGIVQQHEGYINVLTEIGQGTTFSLYFPALHTGASTFNAPSKATLQPGHGEKILLVEDNSATREALRDSLSQLNYEVLTATNGREALTILAAQAADINLIVSDVVMPEMGGIALFHALQEQNLPIPLVLLTGHPLSKEMENLQTMGLAGWLPKPPDLVTLSSLLAEIL